MHFNVCFCHMILYNGTFILDQIYTEIPYYLFDIIHTPIYIKQQLKSEQVKLVSRMFWSYKVFHEMLIYKEGI